jgi:hypothetical protein
MSVGSVQTNPWTASMAAQSGTAQSGPSRAGGKWSAAPTPPPDATGPAPASTSTNPFQSLASDIQAMLIQAQGTTSTGTATGAPATTATTTPEQGLAADLQNLMNAFQSGQSPAQTGTTSSAQTASANPADAPNQAEPHHHHHHHHGGGAGDAGSITAAAAPTPPPASGPVTSGSGMVANQAVSQAFAADIVQAIQAYGTGASASAASALTA